tara:strand:- start:3158 stop:4693 length:1536 start_codon:yes stop_codon:yes gene_type:complete
MQSIDRTLLKLDYFLAKHEEVGPEYDRPDAADDPRAEKHQIEENAPGEKGSPETPTGKVRTKIYELVHRGGRTFERARTAWVNPNIAEHLEQRKKAADWIRTLGNYLPIYFVGGYVRDKFFKKVSKDLDLVATVDLEQAKNILKQLNIEFKEKNNSHARLSFMIGGIRVDLISTTGEELLKNLRSRDFTINAIAQSVTGQFYDPTRGLEDVKKKWLRSPNSDSVTAFESDPARILRGARFLADYPLKPHPSFLSGVKKTAEKVGTLKKRRIGYEVVKIVQTEKPWISMKFLADYDILKHICVDLNKMVGFKQRGPSHMKDVWGHTLAALKYAKSDDLVLNLAILFHDIGKPHTATDDQKSFPGHDKKGAEITKKALTDLGLPDSVVKRVTNIVENHLFVAKVGTKGQPEEYRKLALTLGGDVDRFFRLVEADAAAHKQGKDWDPDLAEKVKALVKKSEAAPVVSDTKDDEELEKSLDLERVLVEDSLNIILGHDTGLTDVEYMLKLVDVNG